jgi:hypothetical protein
MPSALSVLLHALETGAAAGAVLAGVWLVGFASLRFSRVRRRARLAVPLALSVGALVVGWTSWILGTLLGTRALFAAPLVLLAASLPDAPRALRAARRALGELLLLARRAPAAASRAAVPVVLTLPQVFLPLFDSDGMRYHVAYAKLFLLEGRVFHYRWDVTGSYPQAAEMLYALAYRLGGVDAPKLVHAGFFVASLGVLVLLVHDGRRRRSPAFLASFLYGISPVALIPAAAAFVDHVAVFHIAVAALLVRRRASAPATGAALGAALATKLPAGPAVLVLGLAAAVRAPGGRRVRGALLVFAAVALAFLPFAVRNAIDTGDPIYPIGRGLLRLPIRGVTPESFRYATRVNADVPGGVPWGEDSAGGRLDEVVGWHHLLGLGALLVAVRNRRLRFLVPLALAYLALAVLFRPPTRYLMPAWLSLAALEAVAVSEWPRARLRALAPVLALPAALVSVKAMLLGNDPFRYLLGRETRSEFLRRIVPGDRAVEVVNALPPGGRVMALDFPPLVYLDRPWIAEGILTEPPLKLWLDEGASGETLLRRLQDLDVRALVVTPGYGGGTPLSLVVLAGSRVKAGPLAELRRHLTLMSTVDGVDVYAVPPRSRE